jgi:hypothetical protein
MANIHLGNFVPKTKNSTKRKILNIVFQELIQKPIILIIAG